MKVMMRERASERLELYRKHDLSVAAKPPKPVREQGRAKKGGTKGHRIAFHRRKG